MPVKSETVEKNGQRFTITQLPGWRSVRLSLRLGKVFAPALAELGGMIPSGKTAGASLAEMDVGALGKAVKTFFESATVEESESIMRELFASVGLHNANNIPEPILDSFDLTMGGQPETIFWLVGEAIRVNYASFLGMLKAAGVNVARSSATETAPK